MRAEFLLSSVASTTEYLAYIPNFKRRTSELNASTFFFFFLNTVQISKASSMRVVFSLETPYEESTVILYKLLVTA